MTVQDLIDKLGALDPAKDVQVADADEGMNFDVADVVDGDIVVLTFDITAG